MNNFHSQIKVVGQVDLKLYDEYNQLIEHRSVKNTITNDGMLSMLRRYVDVDAGSSFTPAYIGIGTGTVAPAVTDTALGAEIGTRVSLNTGAGTRPQIAYNGAVADFTSFPSGAYTVASNQISWQATIPADGTSNAITEAGIFSATTGGSMFARTTFSSLTKAAGSSLYISWTITFPVTYTVTGLGTGKIVVVRFGTTNTTISANGVYQGLLNDPKQPTIAIQPSGQLCSVSGVSSDNIVITCVNGYTVGGTVAGVARSSSFTLQIKINGVASAIDLVVPPANTTFNFNNLISVGSTYEVYVFIQPTGQTVTLTNATGTMGNGNVTNVIATVANNP